MCVIQHGGVNITLYDYGPGNWKHASSQNICINLHFFYVRLLDCAGQVYLYIYNRVSTLNKTRPFQFFFMFVLVKSGLN